MAHWAMGLLSGARMIMDSGCARRLRWVLAAAALTACAGNTSDRVWADGDAKQSDANRFTEHLRTLDGAKPVFGVTRPPSQMEIEALDDFADRIGGGAFIFGGDPTFLIDISRREEPILGGNIQLTYRVQWREAATGEVLAENTALGKCRDAEALIVYPPRCSAMRRRTLDAALYGL